MDTEREIFMNNNTIGNGSYHSIREFYRDAVVFVTGTKNGLKKHLEQFLES